MSKQNNKKRPDRGEYRGVFVALADDPDFQDLSIEAQWVFFILKLRLGRAGIDVFYPAALAEQYGKGIRNPSANPSANPSSNPLERVGEAVDELVAEGWVLRQRNVYWIRNGLRHDPAEPLKSPNMRTGIEQHLKTLPKLDIVNEMARYYGLTPPFPDLDKEPDTEPFQEPFQEPFEEPLPEGLPEYGRRKTEDRGTTNGAKAPTAAPPKNETETEADKELHRLRSAAVPLIQTHLWLGDKPPKPGWHKGRDLSIWNEMLKQFSPHEINGAITVCRTVVHEEIGMRPITMEYFNVKDRRDRMSRCVAAWRQSETRKLAAERRGLRLIGDDIEEVVRAAAG